MSSFAADYVDRGAWSVETYALLLAWKVFLPKHVILIRGNHETKYCAHVYGFKQELEAKYGAHSSRGLFKKLLVRLPSGILKGVRLSEKGVPCSIGLVRAVEALVPGDRWEAAGWGRNS